MALTASATPSVRKGSPTSAAIIVAILAVAAVAWWSPLASEQRWAVYCAAEVMAMALACVLSLRARASAGWWWLLGGMALNVVADVLYFRETVVAGMGLQAGLSDFVYVSAYVPMLVGLAMLGRRVGRDNGALLDAAIFAIGLALPAVAFYIVPTASDTTVGVDGLLLLGWYALGSILVFALYLRQLSAGRSRNPAYLILGVAFLMQAIGDTIWNVHALGSTPLFEDFPKVLWFLNRCLPLAAVAHPAVRDLWRNDPADTNGAPPLPRLRLAALTLGLSMPALTLLLSRLAPDNSPYWIAIAGGGLLLPAMVLVRMDGLVRQLRSQAVRLDRLSRSDELTGAPNRREWNRALAEAAARAREAGEPVAVGVLDLDHFKEFNDANGHHAGDTLLRDAYLAWSALLPPRCLLARYGGEEFALLMPGGRARDAAGLLERMQDATPEGQTFSAGVCECDVDGNLANVLDRADMALYEAKQAGRQRIRTAGDPLP